MIAAAVPLTPSDEPACALGWFALSSPHSSSVRIGGGVGAFSLEQMVEPVSFVSGLGMDRLNTLSHLSWIGLDASAI